MLTAGEIAFVREHLEDDVHVLLLAADKYPGKDVPKCVRQIEGLRKIRYKVPEWFACRQVFIPSLLAAEQCSSAETAAYKRRFIHMPGPVVDITGGLGVDSYYLSKSSDNVIYAERDDALCRAAENNFKALGAAGRIRVVHSPAQQLWKDDPRIPYASLVYADPSRRDDAGRRLYDITRYSPDVTALRDYVLQRADAFLVKISPLADISRTLSQLKGTVQVHVVSSGNECKELLFLLNNDKEIRPEPLIVCGEEFSFHQSDEILASATLQKEGGYAVIREGDYLYEPGVSLLKAGAFALPALRYPVKKIHRHSHLYTSSVPVPGFPGRKFRIGGIIPFTSGNLKKIRNGFPKANMSVRNFPLTVEQWRHKTGITEGGPVYLFGTTGWMSGEETRMIIQATKWEETI